MKDEDLENDIPLVEVEVGPMSALRKSDSKIVRLKKENRKLRNMLYAVIGATNMSQHPKGAYEWWTKEHKRRKKGRK